MITKTVSILAALTLLVASAALYAQQPAPYQPPTYQAPPPSYPTQAPTYQQPTYQQQAPAYQQPQQRPPQQPAYQQPSYQQPTYQQPPQQPAYQQPSYQQPSYQQPGYQQQRPPTYAPPPAGYAQPPGGYAQPPPAAPAGYAQPAPAYGQQYAQPSQAYPTPQNYPQGYPSAAPAAGAAVAGATMTQAAGAQQNDLYPTHEDTRFGHDHAYPNRGVVVRDVPRNATVINYAGLSYHYADGVWYEPRGPAYMVVSPPVGLVVPGVPSFSTPVESMGITYYYANNAFYRQRPDLAGYEVVNDPSEAMPLTAGAAGMTPSGAPLVTAAATMGVATAMPPLTQGSTFVVFPKNGQTQEEQARDHYACYQFAVSQTGFDPTHPPAGLQPGQTYAAQTTFQRAQAACYEGRGYTVR